MRKAKVIDPPARIFLQVAGDEDSEDVNYADVLTENITWHDERIFDADVEYRLVKRSARTSTGGGNG